MVKFLRLLLIFLAFAFTASAQSEDFRNFKVDITLGYASPITKITSASSVQAGISGTEHFHYRLSNAIAVGVRFETALLAYSSYDAASGYYTDASVTALNSYCLSGEYYFSDDAFRPFIGVAAGLFNKTSVTVTSLLDDSANADISLGINKFGVAPTIGFELGHFRLQTDYNYIPDKNSYWGIKAGFFIGGGRREGSEGGGRSGRSRGSNREGGFRF